jgi:hypothetical protein
MFNSKHCAAATADDFRRKAITNGVDGIAVRASSGVLAPRLGREDN